MANPIFLDRKEAHRRIVELGKRFGFEIDPDAKVEQPVGRLAAAGRDPQGALSRGADPRPRRADRGPDAAGDEGDLRRPPPARRRGPLDHLHQPQALRGPRDRRPDHGHPPRARSSATRLPAETDEDDLAELMVGRERPAGRRPRRVPPGRRDPRASRTCGSPTTAATRPSRASRSTSGPARSSAIAGVAGNGQDELVEALTGLRKPTAGTVELNGKDVTGHGSARPPAGRHVVRAGRPPPVRAGPQLPARGQPGPDPVRRGAVSRAASFRNEGAIREWAERAIDEYDIRTPSPSVNAGTLSGGNQQKAVVAREFSRDLTRAGPRPADAWPRRRQHRVHPPPGRSRSATTGRRSCSSRPSSTRSWSSPTGSR